MCKLFIPFMDYKKLKDENGRIPLHYAAEHGLLDICKFLVKDLVENNGDPNLQDDEGTSPLDLGTFNEHKEVVQFLEDSNLLTTILTTRLYV